VGTTHRYKGKYVTSVLDKPRTADNGQTQPPSTAAVWEQTTGHLTGDAALLDSLQCHVLFACTGEEVCVCVILLVWVFQENLMLRFDDMTK